MDTVAAIVFLSFVGLSQERWYSDETACVGDKSDTFNIGSPDDPLTIHFQCDESKVIATCSLNDVATIVKDMNNKKITLPSGNTYHLYCYSYFAPTIYHVIVPGICKGDSPKATVTIEDSTEKIDVSFTCNWLKSKISTCTLASDPNKSFATSDKLAGRFGGRSGRKYIINCRELYNPSIREDYSAERCYEQTKFVDSIAVTGTGKRSGEKIDVEFVCEKGTIAECRPPGGNVIRPISVWHNSFKKGSAEFKLDCSSTSPPIITPKKST